MLPVDHVEVFDYLFDPFYDHPIDGLPVTKITFRFDGNERTPEGLLEKISAFPQHVKFQGNALHQDHDFLRLVLVELTNRGHIVTISDLGDRAIPWKLIMPSVRYELLNQRDTFRNDNYRKLSEFDMVQFLYINRYDWDDIEGKLAYARKEWNPPCRFKIITSQGSIPYLRGLVEQHKLEVEVGLLV